MTMSSRRRPFVPRLIRGAATLLLLGASASILVAWVLSFVSPNRPVVVSESRIEEDGSLWTTTVEMSRFSVVVMSLRQSRVNRAWGPEQIIGPADSPVGVDSQSAWASKGEDGRDEWIEVRFAASRPATGVRVHESFNPGSIRRLVASDSTGAERELWRRPGTTRPALLPATRATEMISRDRFPPEPTAPMEVLGMVPVQALGTVSVDPSMMIHSLLIDLNSMDAPGWNEIDAVELLHADGVSSWAIEARASTTYAEPSGRNATPEALLPYWSRVPRSAILARDPAAFDVQVEEHALGWPLVVMVDEVVTPAPLTQPRNYSQRRLSPDPIARQLSVTRGLPLRPIAANLLTSAAIYGCSFYLLGWLLWWPLGVVRELLRMRRGLCPECGYDLRYDFAAGCPECGFLRDSAAPSAVSRERSPGPARDSETRSR